MRLIKVSAPVGLGDEIKDLAFTCGIKEVSLTQADVHSHDSVEKKDVIDIQTSTDKAKHFIDEVLNADFFDPDRVSVSTRTPMSIVARDNVRTLTWPLVIPVSDLLEEHWQFSHITIGFAGRIFIGGSLLAFGMIRQQMLIIIAAMLFLPLLPLLLATSFGVLGKQYRLARQGLAAFLTAMGILFIAGVVIAAVSQPPMKYDEFNPIGIGILISLAVGVAAVLAGVDDAGRRELLGLAATSQLALVPVWFGVNTVFGFSPTLSGREIASRALGLGLNAATILIASALAYISAGSFKGSLKKLENH